VLSARRTAAALSTAAPGRTLLPGEGSFSEPPLLAPDLPGPSSRAAGVPRIAAAFALPLLVILVLALVALESSRPSFLVAGSLSAGLPAWMRGPLGEVLPRFRLGPSALQDLSSWLLIAIFACYLVAARWATRLRPSWTLAAIAAAASIVALGPPFDSHDVFNYINYGHMAAVDHLNPYSTIPLHGPHAGLSYALSDWRGLLSPYGPLLTQLTEPLATLGVATALWALKLLDVAAYFVMLALVWRCAKLLGRSPTTAVAFVGLNPLALVWALGGVHYDVLVMALVVGGVYLCLSARAAPIGDAMRRQLFAGAAFAFAVALKAPALLFVPIVALRARSRRFLFGLGTAGAGLAAVSVASFGLHGPALGKQDNLISTHAPADVVGYLLGLGGETHGMHLALSVLLVVALLGCCAWTWRSPDDWLTAAGTLTLVFVTTLSWTVPWYVLWVLPFAALGSRRLRWATLATSACFLILFAPAEPRLAARIGLNPYSTQIGQAAGRAVAAFGG